MVFGEVVGVVEPEAHQPSDVPQRLGKLLEKLLDPLGVSVGVPLRMSLA